MYATTAQTDGQPTVELDISPPERTSCGNEGGAYSYDQLDLQQGHVLGYFHKNVDGKDFERFREVYVRRNPALIDNPHHGETLINYVGEGVGLIGTKID
jgi:hypothetical protein